MKLALAFLCYNDSSAPYLEYFLSSVEKSKLANNLELVILAGDNSDQLFLKNEEIVNNYKRASNFEWHYLRFENNLGFAAAYNRLIKKAEELEIEYFLMLNPDMLIDEHMIKILLDDLVSRPEAVAVCPKIYSWDFNNNLKTNILDSCGIIMKAGLRFSDLGQGEEDRGLYDSSSIFGPSGAAALLRLSVLDKVQVNDCYFDENFFMYKEDCDLAYRLKKAGYHSYLSPSALAYHDRSLALKSKLKSRIQDWRYRSRVAKAWSFRGQHLLFFKYWRNETIYSQMLILAQIILYFFFSLLLANYLLKHYPKFNQD
jgi:GT2 family glycosyltransferase